jgi:hypothetical protein
MVGKDTGSYTYVTKEYNVLPAQLDGLIKTVALKLECNRAMAENILCEALRKNKAYDFQFAGQSLYKPSAKPPDVHEVIVLRSNGEEALVPEFSLN